MGKSIERFGSKVAEKERPKEEMEIFTPLKERELFLERYKVYCNIDYSESNSFKIIRISEEEKKDIFFLYSAIPTL